MRKTNLKEADSFTDRLKSEIKSQAGKMGIYNKGTEGVMAINNVVQSLGEDDNQLDEKWSEKYKNSIDCNNPKGFSQKAHCQGKKKKSEAKEATGSGASGAFVGPVGFDPDSDFVKRSFDEKPKKIEATEATGSGSAGSYETTASWAKSMKKKDWRGASKTQIPGGKFVQVKKKCKKFPYCNQGDIKALKIWENKTLQKVISDISEKQNISESVIKNIIAYELGLI
jgi:hypothetical protein